MQHFLLENIEWDCDGMKPVEDCNLPLTVLAVNVPPGGPDGISEDELEEHLGECLSETYGFLHYGFTLSPVSLDSPGHRRDWAGVAVMDARE